MNAHLDPARPASQHLESRIRRLRRVSLALLAITCTVGLPATFLWGKGGYSMFGNPERTSKFVILLSMGAGACGIVAALLALRATQLSDRLPRGR